MRPRSWASLFAVRAALCNCLVSVSTGRFLAAAALARAADWRPRAAAASGKTENKLLGFIGNVPKNLLGPIPNPLIVLTIRHLR